MPARLMPLTFPATAQPCAPNRHQSDLAHFLFTLLEHARSGQAYKVGSDEVISIAALANLVRDILAPDKPVHILRKADIGSARNRYVPDIRKAQRDLGLSVTIPLAEAISQMPI